MYILKAGPWKIAFKAVLVLLDIMVQPISPFFRSWNVIFLLLILSVWQILPSEMQPLYLIGNNMKLAVSVAP